MIEESVCSVRIWFDESNGGCEKITAVSKACSLENKDLKAICFKEPLEGPITSLEGFVGNLPINQGVAGFKITTLAGDKVVLGNTRSKPVEGLPLPPEYVEALAKHKQEQAERVSHFENNVVKEREKAFAI